MAALGLLNPVLAGAAMALSSVSVVTNALLLRRWRPAQGAAPLVQSVSTVKQGEIPMELKVEGMSCQHCVGRVTKTVQEIDPAAKVAIDLANGQVHIDSGVERARFVEAIDRAGYPVAAG